MVVAFRLGRFPDFGARPCGFGAGRPFSFNVRPVQAPETGSPDCGGSGQHVCVVGYRCWSIVLRLCVGGLVAKVWFFQRQSAMAMP